jgi:hypothetical protein
MAVMKVVCMYSYIYMYINILIISLAVKVVNHYAETLAKFVYKSYSYDHLKLYNVRNSLPLYLFLYVSC